MARKGGWQKKEVVIPCHELKTHPEFFEDIVRGRKTFDVRKNDRGFERMDRLHLREWDPELRAYTGRELRATIYYMASPKGLRKGYVILGLVVVGRRYPTIRLEMAERYKEKRKAREVSAD